MQSISGSFIILETIQFGFSKIRRVRETEEFQKQIIKNELFF
jgi:hypothetical protein